MTIHGQASKMRTQRTPYAALSIFPPRLDLITVRGLCAVLKAWRRGSFLRVLPRVSVTCRCLEKWRGMNRC